MKLHRNWFRSVKAILISVLLIVGCFGVAAYAEEGNSSKIEAGHGRSIVRRCS